MDKFCSYCGVLHTAIEYPKICTACGQTTWKNPTPVAVIVQPVIDIAKDRRGVLIGQRGIEPRKGEWGLIGGVIDCPDKDVIEAARREYKEETGFDAVSRDDIRLVSSYSDGKWLLIFVQSQTYIGIETLDAFVPNHETMALRVAWEPEELCFVSHTQALAAWFAARPKTSEV